MDRAVQQRARHADRHDQLSIVLIALPDIFFIKGIGINRSGNV
jgi:hypothetical protein